MSLSNVSEIVLVLSGKGGVGKSSITTQLALSLALAGRSVGILDIDLTGPSIPRLLGIEDAKVKQAPGGWLPVEVHAAQLLPPPPPATFPAPSTVPGPLLPGAGANGPADDRPGPPGSPVGSLHAMSLAFLLSSRSTAVVWRGPKKTAMVRQFLSSVLWPPIDYLVVDTPPGTSDEHISLVETLLKQVAAPAADGTHAARPRLAGAVVVTTPQAIALSDVRKELNFCAKTRVPVIGVVENMSGYVCPCCGEVANLFSRGGGQVMARDFGVPFLGAVPVDALWGALVEEGIRPVYGDVVGKGDDDGRGAEDEGDGGTDGGGREAGGGATARDVEGPLVDRYRSCSLCPVFEAISRKVEDCVRDGSAVNVKGGSSIVT